VLCSSLIGWAAAHVPVPWRKRAPELYRLVLAIVGVASIVGGLNAVWRFGADVAGISFGYARHIARGDGPVAAVGGPWVEGYSNPLWVFVLVPVEWLGLNIPAVARLLGAGLFGLALGFGVAWLGQVRGHSFRQWGASEAAFVVASAVCLELVVWAPSGLENGLFAALSLLVLWLDARESEIPSHPPWSGLAAFLLSITRPEGVLYAAPIVVSSLVRLTLRRPVRRQLLRAALLFVAPLAVYHGVRFLVFGQLVPTALQAAHGNPSLHDGLEVLLVSARESRLSYAAPLVLVGLLGRPRLVFPPLWMCIAGALCVVYSGGEGLPHARLMALFAPAWLLLAALGLGRLSVLAARASRGHVEPEPWALVLGAPLLLLWYGYQAPRLAQASRAGACDFCDRSADTLRVRQLGERATLPMQSFLTGDVGAPVWLSDERFYPIDWLGRCDQSLALIRGLWRSGAGGDHHLLQYSFHEQPTAPSWVLLEPSVAPGFAHSLERKWDYFELPPQLLPKARRDASFGLFRGELVDYFPSLPRFELRELNDRLGLLGLEVFADPARPVPSERWEPGAHVLAVVNLVASTRLRGTEQVVVRIGSGDVLIDSKRVALDRGIEGLAGEVLPGEAFSVELPMILPERAAGRFAVSFGLGHAQGGSKRNPRAGHAPIFSELSSFEVGAPLAPLRRALPRYPSALPAALDPELFRLQPEVTQAVERSRALGLPIADAELSRELIRIGSRLEAQGQREQAYLANVFATQVNRRAWEALAGVVLRLRPEAREVPHATELALLRRFYAKLSPDELARLVAFYLSEGRVREADYFWRRWPAAAPETEQRSALRVALAAVLSADGSLAPLAPAELSPVVAFDPLGGALDFESPELAGWTGALDLFRSGPALAASGSPAVRGKHGRGTLSSRGAPARAQGELFSPEFVLSGRVLSLLVAGGSDGASVGVELLVGGVVAFAASGGGSAELSPVFWNVKEHAGKTARLRVFDRSQRDDIGIDRVLLWR
jgi:hypothetical protein